MRWLTFARAGRLRRACLPLVAVALAAAAFAPAASGHAAFVESTPGPGARLEQSPANLTLEFTEPLISKLTRASIVGVQSGERIPVAVSVENARTLVLRPETRLETAAYRVEWHTVSTQDGHALEGAFGFGVRVPAGAVESSLETSPLAREGWLRVALRGLFYVSLLFFGGGVLCAILLGHPHRPASWLLPQLAAADADQLELDRTHERAWRRTSDAGWAAAASGVAVALVEAWDAGGGLSLARASEFLLSNVAGLGRVGAVLALIAAAALVRRAPVAAAVTLTGAFLGVSMSGHANSAEGLRLLAVLSDWTHLLAGAVWVGGIAQIAAAWLPRLARRRNELRLALLRDVLRRFGTVAIPAFLIVAATGLLSALIQLGGISPLWQSAYGRVLAVKIALVALIALASYAHARRIRPRLLQDGPAPDRRLERRHWRLLGGEPLLGAAVAVAAALLVAFPLPPRQLGESEADEAQERAGVCEPCPQRKPKARQLAAADQAGSALAAAWLEPTEAGLRGELRLYGLNMKPAERRVRIPGAQMSGCGRGCFKWTLDRRPRTVEAHVKEGGKTYVARFPGRWVADGARAGRRLLASAQRVMRGLDALRQYERVTSGPGSLVITRYRLTAPDRLAYGTDDGARAIVIGERQWRRSEGTGWERQRYGGGLGFRTRSWFRWTTYARAVRLIRTSRRGGKGRAVIALMDEATPLWYTLTIDLETMRVVKARMVADGHFMLQRFSGFNEPISVEPPTSAVPAT